MIMKKIFKNILTWLTLGVLMMILQIIGMALGMQIFPSEIMDKAAESGGNPMIFFLTCLLNAGAILYFIKHSTLHGWRLAAVIFIIGFGFMFFMSQIETLWFNKSVKFPLMGIYGLVTGGAIMFLLFSISATWLTGHFKKANKSTGISSAAFQFDWKRIVLISAVLWPFLYWTAGYFIAWQFEAIRIYYTGTAEKESILVMFPEYINSGLYMFQIFRGFVWVFLSILVLKYMDGSRIQKGFALVMMLVFLCCIQLLLENPFMPEAVRMGHLLETSIENAILAIIMVWVLVKTPKPISISYSGQSTSSKLVSQQ